MSRTFRRKNYEDTQGSSWRRKCRKVNGYYTEIDLDYKTWLWYGKVPDKRELYKLFKRAHGESSTHWRRGPSPWFRTNEQAKLRMQVKGELARFVKCPEEHEVIISYKRAYWD
jgi:hypothetical protein